MELTHVNERGEARMVDILPKAFTVRSASAQAVVRCGAQTIERIVSGGMPKGDVFSCARIAGIMAAKKTAELIPMCHPLPLTSVAIDIRTRGDSIRIVSKVSCVYQTGVEMEALTAATVAALTVYDMCKAVDKGMVIENVLLLEKTGGRSGVFIRPVVTAIHAKKEKGSPPVSFDTYEILHDTYRITRVKSDAGDHDANDDNGNAGQNRLSLITTEDRKAIETFDGICAKRYWANIEVSRLPGGAEEGSFLRLGGALCKISRIGRPCHRLCDAGKAGETCALVTGSVYVEIIEGGALSVGDEVTIERLRKPI